MSATPPSDDAPEAVDAVGAPDAPDARDAVAPGRPDRPERRGLARAAALVAVAFALLVAPPASMLELVRSDDPWIVYDEYVIPEAGIAHVLGRSPATVFGTPAAPRQMAAAAIVVLRSLLPEPPVPPPASTRERLALRIDEGARRLLLDPRPLVIALRWLSVAAGLAAAVLIGGLGARLADDPWRGARGAPLARSTPDGVLGRGQGRAWAWAGASAGALLLLQPPMSYLLPTSLAEASATLALAAALVVACSAARRMQRDEASSTSTDSTTSTTSTTHATCAIGASLVAAGLLAGLASAEKSNFGAAAGLGVGLFLLERVVRGPSRRRPAVALAAFAGSTVVGFLLFTPFALARPTEFLKSQLFTIVEYGGRAGESSSALANILAGFGLPLLVVGAASIIAAFRHDDARRRLLAWTVVGYVPLLLVMDFAKVPWLLPLVVALLPLVVAFTIDVGRHVAARRPRPAMVGALLPLLLVAVIAAWGAATSVRTLEAARAPGSSGRSLRAWAREALPGGGAVLVVGRHLELPPTPQAARRARLRIEELLARRTDELPVTLSGPLLAEERFAAAVLRLLEVEREGDPPRHDVEQAVGLTPEEIHSAARSGRYERIVIPEGLLHWLGDELPPELSVERRFPAEPDAPPATSWPLVVLRHDAVAGGGT